MESNKLMSITDTFTKLKESKIFQTAVASVIILSSVIVGVGTYELDSNFKKIIYLSDYAITIFFVIEILIRFFGEKIKTNFFRDGWNIFDLIIVISSLIPSGAGTSVVVLRLLRLMRLLRVISFIPEMRFVIEALLMSLRKSIYVLILIFILLYIYAVAGVILFEQIENSRFSHIGEALLTLVQIMTLSSWETVMLPILDVMPAAWLFFITFVVLSSIIVLNLFVAILVDVVSEMRRAKEIDNKTK
jgi:voltage-gated sodium channel